MTYPKRKRPRYISSSESETEDETFSFRVAAPPFQNYPLLNNANASPIYPASDSLPPLPRNRLCFEYKFMFGDRLETLPSHLMKQLQDNCEQFKTETPSCAYPRWRESLKKTIYHSEKGRSMPTPFVVPDAEETLLSGVFACSYTKTYMILVWPKAGSTQICPSFDEEPKIVIRSKAEHRWSGNRCRWYIWDPYRHKDDYCLGSPFVEKLTGRSQEDWFHGVDDSSATTSLGTTTTIPTIPGSAGPSSDFRYLGRLTNPSIPLVSPGNTLLGQADDDSSTSRKQATAALSNIATSSNHIQMEHLKPAWPTQTSVRAYTLAELRVAAQRTASVEHRPRQYVQVPASMARINKWFSTSSRRSPGAASVISTSNGPATNLNHNIPRTLTPAQSPGPQIAIDTSTAVFAFKRPSRDDYVFQISVNAVHSARRLFVHAFCNRVISRSTDILEVTVKDKPYYIPRGEEVYFEKLVRNINKAVSGDPGRSWIFPVSGFNLSNEIDDCNERV